MAVPPKVVVILGPTAPGFVNRSDFMTISYEFADFGSISLNFTIDSHKVLPSFHPCIKVMEKFGFGLNKPDGSLA